MIKIATKQAKVMLIGLRIKIEYRFRKLNLKTNFELNPLFKTVLNFIKDNSL